VALASPYSVESCFQRLVDTKSQDGAHDWAGLTSSPQWTRAADVYTQLLAEEAVAHAPGGGWQAEGIKQGSKPPWICLAPT
jgi:hypothetical protein